MAFGTFTLTGHFEQYGGLAAAGVVTVTTPAPVKNTAGDEIRLGPAVVALDAGGECAVPLPSDSTTGNSTTVSYTVTVALDGLSPVGPVTFAARPIGSTVDIADLI